MNWSATSGIIRKRRTFANVELGFTQGYFKSGTFPFKPLPAPHSPGNREEHHQSGRAPIHFISRGSGNFQRRNYNGREKLPFKNYFTWRYWRPFIMFLDFSCWFLLICFQLKPYRNPSIYLPSTNISEEKQRCCWVLQGFMQKTKKEINFLLKTIISRVTMKSKKI